MPPRPFRVTTEADAEGAAAIPDLVRRDFTADRPGIKFVGDITYIHTWQGFIYLATVIDCYSRKVVGWSVADHMRTSLVAHALRNAAATTLIAPWSGAAADRAGKLAGDLSVVYALLENLAKYVNLGAEYRTQLVEVDVG